MKGRGIIAGACSLCLLAACGEGDPKPEVTTFQQQPCSKERDYRDCYLVELEIPDILYGTATCAFFAQDEGGSELMVGPVDGTFDFGPHTVASDEISLPLVEDSEFDHWDLRCFFPEG